MIATEQFGEITQIQMGRDLGGRVLYWVAAYLADDLLIDTGCRHTAEELLAYLECKTVNHVYLTHYHEDHIGGCALLNKYLNLNIQAHASSISLINSIDHLYPYQELVWGYPEQAEIQALNRNEIKTKNFTFQIMETPGHSPDHTVLIEPNRGWCFSGDLFISERIKVLRPEEDIGKIMQSMQKLIEFETDPSSKLILFTSIGKVVPEGRKALKNCLNYLENLGKKAAELHSKEGLSEEQIVARIFGAESALAELTDEQFASKNLIGSLLKNRQV